MLAHQGARAGCSRMSFVGGVSPPSAEVPNPTTAPRFFEKNASSHEDSRPPGRPAWKYAYEDLLWSKQTLPLNLRGILQVLLRLSDHLGRVWWSQPAIAEHAGCTVRTLRRLLPALEKSGFARVEAMTFRQLALAQAGLGLPLPGRNDDGQAPDLITLLVDGKPATNLRPAFWTDGRRKRSDVAHVEATVRPSVTSPGQTILSAPRTSLSSKPSENLPGPADKSSADPRDLSVDLYRNGGDPIPSPHPSKPQLARCGTTAASDNAPSTEAAWRALEEAYEQHYRRVYHARPTNKPLPTEARMLMAEHLAEMSTLLQARFAERNVNLQALGLAPVQLLAEEALRVWFDSSGSNDYLRRVSHRMSALPADLPYRIRKAIDTLVERHAPKPEPRRPTMHVHPVDDSQRPSVSTDRQEPTATTGPNERASQALGPTLARTNLTAEAMLVIEGLSQYASLVDLAQSPTLATELVMLAKEQNASMSHLREALDVAGKVCQRQRMASASTRSGLVYKIVHDNLVNAVPRHVCA